MKKTFLLFFIFGLISCQFHYVENPGQQISWSVSEAKKNKTFICEYRLLQKKINGVGVDAIFAEKKYTSDGGFFSKYKLDSINSQLIIVTRDYLTKDGEGFGINWGIQGFNSYSGKIAYRNFREKKYPDSIPLVIIKTQQGDTTQILERLMLIKNSSR